MQIINCTDPGSPQAVSNAIDGVGGFTELKGARDVSIFTIDARTFAIVASKTDKGAQIIDLSDPSNPLPEGIAENGNGFQLNSPQGVRAFKIGVRPYALVAAYNGDGVQLLDLNEPSSPVAVDYAADEQGGFTALEGPRQLDTFFIGIHAFAIVASSKDNGVQIISLPYTPPPSPPPSLVHSLRM